MVALVAYADDMGTDPDNIVSLARAAAEARAGNLTLLWLGLETSEENGPSTADAALASLGVAPAAAIAAWNSSSYVPGPFGWSDYVTANFAHPDAGTAADADEYVASLRQVLHDADDGTVTLVFAGPLKGAAALLDSPADGIDGRDGSDLIAAKVDRTYICAGRPGDAAPEANVDTDRASAAHVAADWPTVIYLDATNIGDDLYVGVDEWRGQLDASNVLRTAYDQAGRGASGRQGWVQPIWDVISGRGGFTFEQGTWSVDAGTGLDTWTPGAGPHYRFVQSNADGYYTALWDSLIIRAYTGPRDGDVLTVVGHQVWLPPAAVTGDVLEVVAGHQTFGTLGDGPPLQIVAGHQTFDAPLLPAFPDSTIVAFLDASDASAIHITGGLVTQADDVYGNHWVQADPTYQPQYDPSVAGLNGLGALLFCGDGGNDATFTGPSFLDNTFGALPGYHALWLVVMAIDWTSPAGPYKIVADGTAAQRSAVYVHGTAWGMYNGSGLPEGGTADGAAHAVEAAAAADGTGYVLVDNVLVASGSAGTSLPAGTRIGAGTGAGDVAGENCLFGYVAAFCVTTSNDNNLPSLDDNAAWLTWAGKFGI